MKKVFMAVLVVLAGVGMSAVSYAVIAGSKHDLNKITGVAMPESQTCIACHTPHNADVSVTDAPLWSHTHTTATYTLYANADATITSLNATTTQPTGISKLCLSCHDGTIAVDSFVGHAGVTKLAADNTANLGTNLKKSHPISFIYDKDLADDDGELKDPTADPDIKKWVKGGKFECSSCHDVHDNVPGATAMLNKSNTSSALCLTCHIK